jgi:hypothetical protein
MATSGSINYSTSRDAIIKEALQQLGIIGADESPTNDDITTCSTTLNMMVKAWQADDIQITSVARRYLFVSMNTSEYSLDDTSARFTNRYTRDQVDGAVSSGANSIIVDNGSPANQGDKIGIYQSDGTMHWSTINALAGTELGFTANLTADVDDNAVVYYYSNVSGRPIDILEAYVRNSSENDRPIDIMSRKDWSELTNKTYDGEVVEIFYDPQVTNVAQGRNARLFTWPQATDPRDIIGMWVKRTLEDFDDADDEPDYPQEFYLPLAFNLAKLVASKYGVPTRDQNYANVSKQADEWYYKVQNYWSRPQEGIRFQPAMEGYEW